jgi:hypothetical protein
MYAKGTPNMPLTLAWALYSRADLGQKGLSDESHGEEELR